MPSEPSRDDDGNEIYEVDMGSSAPFKVKFTGPITRYCTEQGPNGDVYKVPTVGEEVNAGEVLFYDLFSDKEIIRYAIGIEQIVSSSNGVDLSGIEVYDMAGKRLFEGQQMVFDAQPDDPIYYEDTAHAYSESIVPLDSKYLNIEGTEAAKVNVDDGKLTIATNNDLLAYCTGTDIFDIKYKIPDNTWGLESGEYTFEELKAICAKAKEYWSTQISENTLPNVNGPNCTPECFYGTRIYNNKIITIDTGDTRVYKVQLAVKGCLVYGFNIWHGAIARILNGEAQGSGTGSPLTINDSYEGVANKEIIAEAIE